MLSNKAEIEVRTIGVVRSPHAAPKGTPIQPRYAQGCEGRVVLEPLYREALADLDGFERIWLIYQFHRLDFWKSWVVPFRDTVARGLFSTRAPTRPSRIGMSCVRLLSVEEDGLRIGDVDVLDGTPVLDIKPYVPAFDAYPEARAGWFDQAASRREEADERFGEGPDPGPKTPG